MKLFIAVLATLAVANAKSVRVASVEDCGGSLLTGSGTLFTDPIVVPGQGQGEITLSLSADLPTDIILEKRVTKSGTGELVPCLGNGFLGSCDVDVCAALTALPEVFCPYFPPELPCECPFRSTGTALTAQITLDVPVEYIQFGEGDYEQTIKVYSAAAPADILGCALMKFTLVNA